MDNLSEFVFQNTTPCIHVDTGVSGEYEGYIGRTKGRMLHFLYDVYGLIRADGFTIDANAVYLGTTCVAFYSWHGSTDIPIFEFNTSRSYDGATEKQRVKLLEFEIISTVGHPAIFSTPFRLSTSPVHGSALIYNLKGSGKFKDGEELLENDVTIDIYRTRDTDNIVVKELASKILGFLNTVYQIQVEEGTTDAKL